MRWAPDDGFRFLSRLRSGQGLLPKSAISGYSGAVRLTSSARITRLIRWGVAKGLLPFGVGAARTYAAFRRSWRDGVPRTFNEKLRYKLIHDRRPLVRIYSDKLQVRGYVRSLLPRLRLPRLLGAHATEGEVMAGIPQGPWVMKGAHGSGMVLVGGPPPVAHETIRRQAREWLRMDYALAYWEWHYHRLPRRVIFEENLGEGRLVPADYKLYVIHQQTRLITVDEGRYIHHTRNLFRPDWTPIPSAKGHARPAAQPPARPALLPVMLEAAETLARDTDFVRVDFYVVDGELCFGELTHAPAAGDFDFEDPALDAEMGSYWELPKRYD